MNEPNDSRLDPQTAAADYVAGDLTPAEAAQFEQALANNPTLACEVAFWRNIHGDMQQLGQPAAPMGNPSSMANVVRHRLAARQGDAQQRWRRLAYRGWSVAAAACLVIVLLVTRDLLRPQPFVEGTFPSGQPIAFLEDGTAISLPARGVLLGPSEAAFYGDDFMPTRTSVVYENAHDVPSASMVFPAVNSAQARPCLGIIVQPVTINDPQYKTGLLVVRVCGDSPASQAGILPGDILLSINGTELYTRYCIAHALKHQKVGSPVHLAFYRQSEKRSMEATTSLGAYFD
jgi:PDZ domain